MAARTLESRLRTRLLPIVALAVVGVGAASITITAAALRDAADARARTIADATLHAWQAELAEGDAPDAAAKEAMESIADRDVRVWLSSPRGAWSRGAEIAAPARAPSAGSCTALEGGYRACASAVGAEELVVVAAARSEDREVVLRTLAGWLAVFVVLAIAAALLATRAAVRGVAGSFAALADWSERVARGEAAEAPRGHTVEIDRLAASIEHLVTQLVEALGRERANSAHIAHELRTPLTAMRAEIDALPPDAGEAAARLRADVARLADVIDAILVLSAPASTRRSDTVVNVADVARSVAPTGVEVIAPDEALVDAEPRLVELAVVNLLDNAAKYANGGARAIKVSREDDAVRVAVIDDGPGLDESARARVFERYWREASDGEGKGLGLALVRAVAERHGGRAEARAPAGAAGGLDIGFTMGPVLAWHDGPSR